MTLRAHEPDDTGPGTSAGRGPARLGTLAVVECRRLGRQGGLRTPTLVVAVLAAAVGLGAFAFLRYLSSGDPGSAQLVAAVPVESTASFYGLFAALVAANWAGRDSQRGMLAVSAVVVTPRPLLVAAQVGAVAGYGLVTGVLVVGLVGMVVLALGGSGGSGAVLAGLAVGAVASALMLVVGHAVGRLCGGPMVAVLACIGWWVVLPLASVLGSTLLPEVLARLVVVLVDTSPVMLLSQATTVRSLSTTGLDDVVIGFVGLLCWALVLVAAAMRRVAVQNF